MKRVILLLILCANLIIGFAQQRKNAIYIYRNDGKFNAFFNEEVDSMRTSRIDLDSIEHEDFVIQEIWTSDSTYRIPLAVIDSISVAPPKNEYTNEVIKLGEEYIPYILSASDKIIKFSNTISSSLLPQKGMILLYEGFSKIFPNGFAGRIIRIDKIDDSIIYECDSVSLEDVYSKIILFDDYQLIEEKTDSGSTDYRLISKRNNKEISFGITLPISMSAGPFSFNAIVTAKWTVRVVLEMQIGKQFYFEVGLSDKENISGMFKCSGKVNNFKQTGDKIFGVVARIPNYPLLQLNFASSPFFQTTLEASTEMSITGETCGYSAFVFENGHSRTKSKQRTYSANTSAELSLSGNIWGGVVTCVGIGSIGNFLSCDMEIYTGPRLEGDVNLNILSGIDDASWYQALKDCKVTYGYRFEAGVAFKARLSKTHQWSYPFLKFVPGINISLGEYYLLPKFSDIKYKLNSNTVTFNTNVQRKLLFPCSVGFNLKDSDKKDIYKQYLSSYWTGDLFTNQMEATVKELDYSGSYTIIPLAKILGYEFQAFPRANFNLSATVYTGGASSVTTSTAQIWGGYAITNEENNQPLVGFCYSSTNSNPIIGNSYNLVANASDNQFSKTITGLQKETTYYYRAYINISDKYYYGDVQCFTTKKEKKLDTDSDSIPPSDPQTPPIAKTGSYFNVQKKSATIVCTYENVAPGTECGYYIEEDTKGTNSGLSMNPLGCVSGSITINLSGLKPNTTYYYSAYARNEIGKSNGEIKSFKTDAEPIPTAKTGDVSDITQNSAVVSSTYENVPEGGKCGVEITCSDWSYQFLLADSEGEYKTTISRLKPNTTYEYCAWADYEGGTVYGEIKRFTTKNREIPDLSGVWTFNQGYLGAKTVYPNLKLKDRGTNWTTYTASGFYGVIGLIMTVYSDLSVSIALTAAQGAFGSFSGYFDEDFTSVSGDSYLYVPSSASWAASPWIDHEPWSFSR